MIAPTLGPYEVDTNGLTIFARTPTGKITLAQVYIWVGAEEAEANARLFAGSLNLLAACKAVIEANNQGMTKEAAKQAIALCKSAVRKVEKR